MASLFKPKSNTYVGVDIGSSFIKLLELSKHSKGYRVDSYSVVHLSEGTVIDNNVQDVPAVADVISKAVRVAGCKNKNAVVSVPSSVVIVREMEFSNEFTEDELEEQIRVEADQYIPYSLDEVAIDFQVLGPSEDNPNLNSVLLVACRQDSVVSREDAVNGAGMDCKIVDVDTYALERSFPLLMGTDTPEKGTIGLIDLGASSMSLYVFEDGVVTYNREQVFGGNDLTHNLSQATDMSIDQIEVAKKTGDLPEDIIHSYVEPFKQAAAQQISRALQFYYSSGKQSQLDRLLLAGGVSGLPALAATVEQELGIPTQLANPFQNMQLASRINKAKFNVDASSLVLACGLALRSFA